MAFQCHTCLGFGLCSALCLNGSSFGILHPLPSFGKSVSPLWPVKFPGASDGVIQPGPIVFHPHAEPYRRQIEPSLGIWGQRQPVSSTALETKEADRVFPLWSTVNNHVLLHPHSVIELTL